MVERNNMIGKLFMILRYKNLMNCQIEIQEIKVVGWKFRLQSGE